MTSVLHLGISGSDDVLVLDVVPGEPSYFSAFRRVGPDGLTQWIVRPPTNGADDVWTDVHVDGDEVVAKSWSCYMVTIDVSTGAGRARAFTK